VMRPAGEKRFEFIICMFGHVWFLDDTSL
jgi:hypothetical protein